MPHRRHAIPSLGPMARAAILNRTRRPSAVREAIASGASPPPPTDLALTRDALTVRGLFPWIPPDPDAGALLIVKGTPPDSPGVAIVGARASDPYGLAVAEAAARDAVSAGCNVVSGGAEGCDAAAHRAALQCKGKTLVVLGSGHDRVYPSHHRPLFEAIVDAGGAIMSPFWPETPPAKHRFLMRNRVIAALAQVVIVARARSRSGALSTSRAAMDLGRPVLAVPGPVGEGLSVGANTLLMQGARAMLGSHSLAAALGRKGGTPWPCTHQGTGTPWAPSRSHSAPRSGLTQDAEQVLDALPLTGTVDLDPLHAATLLPVPSLLSALLELELSGHLKRTPGGVLQRSAAP